MNLADKYTYQTAWSEEDGEFVATVLEFPSLSWLDSTAATAESELRIPQSLHRSLTIEAEREGVSPNTLIVQNLASA